MRQSDWCEIHTLMQQSDCEVHTTLHAKREVFFIEKKITENCVVGYPTISLISSFFICLQDLQRNALICELASLWFLGIIIR